MRLEKGMYVRYKYENCIYIGKIKFICEVMGFEETLQMDIDNCIEEILKKDIIKSSYNIIDLIELGDYVNGEKVFAIHYHYLWDEQDIGTAIEIEHEITAILNEDIKSILTKEQFEAMKYEASNE